MFKRLDMKGVVKTYSMNIEQQKSKVYRFLFYSLSQTSFILFLCHLLSQFKGFAKPQGQFVCIRFAGKIVQRYKYSSIRPFSQFCGQTDSQIYIKRKKIQCKSLYFVIYLKLSLKNSHEIDFMWTREILKQHC